MTDTPFQDGFVNPQDIDTGGLFLHDQLPDALIARIQAFKSTLSEFDTAPLEATIDDYRRDADPEKEIQVMERIAAAYQQVTSKHPESSAEDRKMIFSAVLGMSFGPEFNLDSIPLSDELKADVRAAYPWAEENIEIVRDQNN